jgi:hypothetical protein
VKIYSVAKDTFFDRAYSGPCCSEPPTAPVLTTFRLLGVFCTFGGCCEWCQATFEDKIMMSDIVFLRAWYPVKPPKFYNPVTSLLNQGKIWNGMRTTGQLRRDLSLTIPR